MKVVIKHHGWPGIAAAPTCCHMPGIGKYRCVGFTSLFFTVMPRTLGRKEDLKIFLNPG